jgi:hypothetical protein
MYLTSFVKGRYSILGLPMPSKIAGPATYIRPYARVSA